MTPIDLVVEEHFHRAAPGGMGGTKAAGNYSPVSATTCCFWTAASACLCSSGCCCVAVVLQQTIHLLMAVFSNSNWYCLS